MLITPEKPYRYQSKHHHSHQYNHHAAMLLAKSNQSGAQGGAVPNAQPSQPSPAPGQQLTPQSLRKVQYHKGGPAPQQAPTAAYTAKRLQIQSAAAITTIDQLLLDERFLQKFFYYFTPFERRQLAQVCSKWRDLLYRNPCFWSGLLPMLQCRELRMTSNQDKVKLYNSIIRRGFHALCLVGATDEDALDMVHSFPLASKHVHSLSLRCSSISDRGLEALLDHLQSLFELELAGCNEITEAGLWACLTPRIVSLSLADCINVADEAVGAVAQLLPSLYEFSLQVSS